MINCTYCFTSDVMYKKYKRLVYTHPQICWQEFKPVERKKIQPDLFSKNLFSRPYLQL